MDIKKVRSVLNGLGLNSLEIDIFICLYEYKVLSPSTISQKINKNRVTVYHACERMYSKNFLEKSNTSFGVKYSAKSVSDIKSNLIEKVEVYKSKVSSEITNLSSIEGWLENIAIHEYKQPVTKIFQGESSLKDIYRLSLESTEILAYYDPWDRGANSKFKDIDNWHTEERIKKKIPIKILMPDTNNALVFSKIEHPLKQTKLIKSSKFKYKDFTIITDKRLLIFSSDDMLGVSIASPSIAENQKTVFNLLWDLL